MEYTHLGRAGVLVSRLCLGTMNFGPQASEAESHQLMDRALEHGINFFDTANVYGGKVGEGITENIIGRWFAQGGERRDRVILATKVYGRMGDRPNQSRVSAVSIRRECEASLRRLQTDHIDVYQMHHIDRDVTWEETWQAMEQLVREGKILYVSSSNFAGWHIARANEQARARHFLGLVSEQCYYNLLKREVETDVIPACREYGMGVIPWSPLNRGILGGALARAETGRRANPEVQKEIDARRPQLERWEALCQELGEQPADVALAWLLAQPGVTGPIIGPRTIEQLDGNLRSLEIKLDEAVLGRIDEIFPGPGAPAPESFAW